MMPDSDLLATGHDPENTVFGNTPPQDTTKGRHFHSMLSNPPSGVDRKKYADPTRDPAATLDSVPAIADT